VEAGHLSGTADAPTSTARWGRRGLALRAEDWLLVGWIVVAAPLVSLAGGSGGPFDSGHPIAGLIMVAGFCGALTCLATRDSGAEGASGDGAANPGHDPGGNPDAGSGVLDSGAIGPLVGGLILVGGTGFAELGLRPEAAFPIALVGVAAFAVLGAHRPRVPTATRRALVTPYVLAAGGLFWGVVHAITGGVDFAAAFVASPSSASAGLATAVGLLVLGAAVYYAMLIYAPRQIAEREGGPVQWVIRFALFVVSVALGIGWLSLLGG
jgi:hypothetical protein